MVEQLKNLAAQDQKLLLDAPVLLSVLASGSPGEINKKQKNDAIKLAHLKTFTADPVLIPFYLEVNKDFEQQFDLTVQQYMPFDQSKREQLKARIENVNFVLGKLNYEYANKLHKSFENYEKHVRKAAHSVFQDFIFPVMIPGLNG